MKSLSLGHSVLWDCDEAVNSRHPAELKESVTDLFSICFYVVCQICQRKNAAVLSGVH